MASGVLAAYLANTSPSWYMASSASCNKRSRTQRCQRASCMPVRLHNGSTSKLSVWLVKNASQLSCVSGKACTNCASALSDQPNRGDLSTRASDTLCWGDTKTSTSATISCTSWASLKCFFSTKCEAMPKWVNSCCISCNDSLVRAMTNRSSAVSPVCCMAHCNQLAACAHSRWRCLSAGSSLGCVRLSRHGLSPTCVGLASIRGTIGNTPTMPSASEPVVWSRKPGYNLACSSPPMTLLTAVITAALLRRVWSQPSNTPSKLSCTNWQAVRNTSGSAPRKR